MNIRNYDVEEVLAKYPVDKNGKYVIEGSLSGSKKFDLDGLSFGPLSGYMDPSDVPIVLEWCKTAGINNLYFFGGQSNLMDVLGEVDKFCETKMSMAKAEKSEEWDDTVKDVLKVEIKERLNNDKK